MTANRSNILVEVCVDSVASAVAAQRGGSLRIELCSGLVEGGITPSAGLIEVTLGAVTIPIQVMIRPRGGDFCYDPDEFETMRRDIALAKRLGVNGVVFGILDVAGKVDIARARQLADEARPLAVTFHRAFDMTSDLFRALEDVCATGADRLLTSGGEATAPEGQETIRQLVTKAQGRIGIMPGGGILPENVRSLVEYTGVTQFHVGLRSSFPSPMQHRNPRVSMGSVEGSEYERFVVLEEQIGSLCSAVAHAG